MSTIRDARYPIILDKERHLYFSLHAIDQLTDKYGGFDDFTDAIQGKKGNNRIRDLIWLLTLLINEGALFTTYLETGQETGAEIVSERIVSLIINTSNLTSIESSIYKAFALSNTGTAELDNADDADAENDDEKTDDAENDEGNAKAGGMK